MRWLRWSLATLLSSPTLCDPPRTSSCIRKAWFHIHTIPDTPINTHNQANHKGQDGFSGLSARNQQAAFECLSEAYHAERKVTSHCLWLMASLKGPAACASTTTAAMITIRVAGTTTTAAFTFPCCTSLLVQSPLSRMGAFSTLFVRNCVIFVHTLQVLTASLLTACKVPEGASQRRSHLRRWSCQAALGFFVLSRVKRDRYLLGTRRVCVPIASSGPRAYGV